MPWSLERFQCGRDLHFVTFTCYRRQPLLDTPSARSTFEIVMERTRRKHHFYITGYVVMPEHVHLLLSEPQVGKLSATIQVIKQLVSRQLGSTNERFWRRPDPLRSTPSFAKPSLTKPEKVVCRAS